MNFQRKRFTEKSTGARVRGLAVQITDISSDVQEEGRGVVVFCDEANTVYMCKEVNEFHKEFVEGWISKLELGLEEAEVVVEPENFIDKVKDVVTSIGETIVEIAEDTVDIIDELKEGASDIAGDIEETAEDIKEIIETKQPKKNKNK